MSITLKTKNFAKSELATSLASGGMGFDVQSGEGARFPATGSGNPFRAVLWSQTYASPFQDPDREIVEAYRSTVDTFVISSRALENTTAEAWSIGDNFMLIFSEGKIEELETEINAKLNTTDAFSGSYNDLSDKPSTFPPSTHTHDDRYYTEAETDTLLAGKSDTAHNHAGVYEPANANIQSHIGSTSNPHSVTKSQVGLGNVDNYATASQAEAEAGTATNKLMTPQRTAQAISALAVGGGFAQGVPALVTGSRAIDTAYQNTTGKTLAVLVQIGSNSSSSGATYAFRINTTSTLGSGQNVATTAGSAAGYGTFHIFVPNNYYYGVYRTAGTHGVMVWTETEIG